MKSKIHGVILSICLVSVCFWVVNLAATPKSAKQLAGGLPLVFERNDGQADASVKFLSRGPAGALLFTPSEIIFARANMRMRFAGAHASPEISGVELLPGRSNYFVGSNSGDWKTDIPQYAKVQYKQLYDGIDLVFYGNQNELEYDVIVAPGADPGVIALEFTGMEASGSGRVGEWEMG